MRKRIIPTARPQASIPEDHWLDLDRLAEVEITSEDPAHPIESALLSTADSGWQAADSGRQTIRLIFLAPQRIRRIWVEFVEPTTERTQEFVLRWSAEGGPHQEIVRQQWNFSPQGAIRETEDYRVDLPNATLIELEITPDTSGGEARATLAHLRIA